MPEFYDRFVRPVALARYLESLMSRTYLRDWQKAGFAANVGGRIEGLANATARTVTVLPRHVVPTRQGDIAAQWYRPSGRIRRATLLVPGILAYIFGFLAFRSRIRGVYFSIITQAFTYALMLLFFRNETGVGGNNGLTNFKTLYGYQLADSSTKLGLYTLSAIGLLVVFLLCRFVVVSKAGRVLCAIRDAESRSRFGYNPTSYKLFVYTFSAIICGFAGALYVPQVGIINPSEFQPSSSIEMAIWVAVGGRGSLLGGALGAFVVNGAKSWFTVALPEAWLYVLGVLFIAVTLFFPGGLASLILRKKAAA